MDRLRDLGCAVLENGGTRPHGSHTQSGSLQHVIGDRPVEGRQDRVRVSPIAQEAPDLTKLVSLVKRSGDRTTLLALSAAIAAEAESLSRQLAKVQADLATESQRKMRQTTLESMDRSTTVGHAKSAWLPAKAARVTLF